MKKSAFLVVALLAFSTISSAQVDPSTLKKEIKDINKQESALKKEKKEDLKTLRKLNGQDVSYQAKQQFLADFANAKDVKWKRSPYFDEAIFTLDGKSKIAYYDHEAKLVGTTEILTFGDLPEKAQKVINEKYKNYYKGAVIFFDDNEFNDTDMLLYGQQFDDEDNYFVELSKSNEKIVVKVKPNGEVFFFTSLK